MDSDKRPNWDSYFIAGTTWVMTRASCIRRQVGAVLARDADFISLGYNGTPAKTPNCDEGGCARCNSDTPSGQGYDQCICIHAEKNTILTAARLGRSPEGCTLYVSIAPCIQCVKELIQVKVKRIVHGGSGVPVLLTQDHTDMISWSGIKIERFLDGATTLDPAYHSEEGL